MRSNKFRCSVAVVVFVYAVLVSRAVSARVRLMDMQGSFKLHVSDDVVVTSQSLHLPASAAGYYRSRDSGDVGKELLRLHGKVKPGSEHRPLVLNLLPRGTLPPSGPSRRKNSFS
ncbi:hypothetical protein V6N13_070165 [Hibiscus sabdariffa]|uniref:Uncharacterized protein n=1 Tax=Hibiscus sabdariffa TaxID=183260 RepID=A0ABR2NB22_9ROSI